MFEYLKKIVIALQFLTRIIEERDARFASLLKDNSFLLMSLSGSLLDEDKKLQGTKMNLIQLRYALLQLIEYVDLAYLFNYITHMNSKIFIDSVRNFIKNFEEEMEHEVNPEESVKSLEEFANSFYRKKAKDSATQISKLSTLGDRENEGKSNSEVWSLPKGESLKREVKINGTNGLHTAIKSEREIEEDEINIRRSKILRALSNGGGNIKDISAKVSDVAEKTIQRDLIELMRMKKVIMLGKKRWAKYYLK